MATEKGPKEELRLIAHDLRNLATVLTAVQESLAQHAPQRDELRSPLHYIEQGLQRLQGIADLGRTLAHAEGERIPEEEVQTIAHDLRNLATVLTAVREALEKAVPEVPEVATPLRFVTIALERLAQLAERVQKVREVISG